VLGWRLNARIDRFLDHLFFGGVELCVLSTPVLLLLLLATPADAVSLSALTTLVAGSTTLAVLRGGYLGSRDWPRVGEVGSFPGRSAYYGAVVGGGTYAGVQVQLLSGAFWTGILVPAAATACLLSLLPPALEGLRRASQADLPWA
jgi:hypothetical protein